MRRDGRPSRHVRAMHRGAGLYHAGIKDYMQSAILFQLIAKLIAVTTTWPGRIPKLTCESRVNLDIKKKRQRPHQHVSHSYDGVSKKTADKN